MAHKAVPAAVPQYTAQTTVDLAPSNPLFTTVDPYANAISSADGLKPARPFWYAVDNDGLTILRVDDNKVVYRVPWPTTYDLALPVGDGPDFMSATAPSSGWEPVGVTVTYPTEEQLASTSETPATYVIVVMKRSGYQWASNPSPAPGFDPGQRDTIVASTSPATESSVLLQLDVTDPSFSPDLFPAGPIWAGALLGHGAGQPAFDPAAGNIYVANMPSTSLPTSPRDLTSFVSVMMPIAVAENAAAEPPSGGPPDPPLVLCGPEHPDEGLLAGTPYVWPCTAEGGEGTLVWEFQGLPSWVIPHADKITGELDGITYGTPPSEGTWTFQVQVTDLGEEPGTTPPNASGWTTVTLNVTATGVAQEAEPEYETGVAGGMGVAGTGDCTPAATASPGSMVPNWIDVKLMPGGCAVMGTPPVSGEYYEFALPGFHFLYPYDREPVIFSGNVLGTYVFDPLPVGVGLSGLAWHQIDKIHDASTEADILNGEMIGIHPFSGQLYQILLPQGSIEINEGAGPPTTQGEVDEVRAVGAPLLESLTSARADIASALAAHSNLKVRFGDLVIETTRDPGIFVSAPQIIDPSGTDATVIPIGGPAGSTIENGAMLKVNGVRGQIPADVTLGAISAISLPGVQSYYQGLDSNVAPAIRGQEPGQIDHGALWVTGPSSGNVAVVDTAPGQVAQSLAVAGATSLGGVSVFFSTRAAYVAGRALQNVTIFGNGTVEGPRAPTIWTGETMTFTQGVYASFSMVATGWPIPVLSMEGTLPSGLTFVAQSDGTATVSGTPAIGTSNDYALTFHAANGVSPDASFPVVLTVVGPPGITSTNTATFTEGIAGSFTVTTTGAPSLIYVSFAPALPSWLVATEDEANGSVALAGTPPAGSAGTYVFTITASTGVPPDATQTFTLVVQPSGGGTGTAPVITSASSTTFVVGSAGSFTVTSTGSPTPTLSYWGTLPGGVTFTNNGNGTATLAGTPTTAGSYPITVTAANGVVPSASQGFTLTVNGPVGTAPTITSEDAAVFTVGAAGSFTVTTTGSPPASLSYWGTLPAGVTFTANPLNGTATIIGTPSAAGNYLFTITAANGILPNATQNFTLTVNAAAGTAPAITSAATATFTAGSPGSFSVTTTGSPAPSLSESGGLPSGVTFVDNGNGTATLAGTPGSAGSYPIVITAANGVLPNATQNFTLTVNGPTGTAPTVTTQPANRTVTAGQTATFTAAASGTTPITAQWQVSTNGGSTWTNITGATSASYTTPATTTSMNGWRFRVVFTNAFGSATSNAATLTVNPLAPPLTVATTSLPSGTVRQSYSYQLQAQGGTPPYTWVLTARNSLPNGLSLSSTGLISGTPRQAGTYSFTVQVRDSGSQSATSPSLTLVIGPRR